MVSTKKMIHLILGHLFLILGIIGIAVPLLPTTPFLLLAAFFYSHSSPKLHNWIFNHKHLGPPLRAWQEHGVIGLNAKILATTMIAAGALLHFFYSFTTFWLECILAIVFISVLTFIWTRPS